MLFLGRLTKSSRNPMEFFHKLTLWDPLPSNLPDFIAEFNSNRRLELATRRGAMPGTVWDTGSGHVEFKIGHHPLLKRGNWKSTRNESLNGKSSGQMGDFPDFPASRV